MIVGGYDISHIDLTVEHHTQCPCCVAEHSGDRSCDNLFVYGEDIDGKIGGFRCFACGYSMSSEQWREENGSNYDFGRKGLTVAQKDLNKFNEKKLTEDELSDIHVTTLDELTVNYRGLDSEVCKELGVRWKIEGGKVSEMLFPANTLSNGKLIPTGYKIRKYPKDFYSKGYVGKINLLAGQTNQVADTLIVVAGEIDLITAIQSLDGLKKYNKTFNVVSSLIGEDSTADSLRHHFDWVDKHSKIIVCMDNDDAGNKAFEKIKAVIDNSKLFKANLKYNDLNDYLKNKEGDQIAKDLYWNAVPVQSFGLIGSGTLLSKALEVVNMERIPLPPFLGGLDEVFRGGIGLQEIVNIVSSVSTGKSVFVNEIVLHWIMNSPYKMLIVSLEDNAGSYGAKIASRIIGEKIMGMRTPEERTKALVENRDQIEKFLLNENGEDRFILMEDATSDLETMKKAIIQSIKVHQTRIILIDPLASLISHKSLDEQIAWMNFEEETRRIYGVTFINVAHTRKSTSGEVAHSEGGNISEEQIKGSSQISATATVNIILRRNKVAEEEVERNTTYVDVTKNRTVGITGKNVAKIYYSNDHHMLFDFDYASRNNFFKGMTSQELFSTMDTSKSAPVTSSLSDVEDVDETELPDW